MVQRRSSMFREMFDEADQPGNERPILQRPYSATQITTRARSATGLRDLKAARSESCWWALDQGSADTSSNKVSKRRSEAYIDVLHRASVQGFKAPPRHEIKEYQQKSLPPTPKRVDTSASIETRGDKLPPKATTRVDSFLGLDVEDCGRHDRNSMLSADFSKRPSEASHQKTSLTWISRVQSRAENNQKAHEYLQKRE